MAGFHFFVIIRHTQDKAFVSSSQISGLIPHLEPCPVWLLDYSQYFLPRTWDKLLEYVIIISTTGQRHLDFKTSAHLFTLYPSSTSVCKHSSLYYFKILRL